MALFVNSDYSNLIQLATKGMWISCRVSAIGKPRMTRSDSWKKRTCVTSYWQFKNDLREAMEGHVPLPQNVVALSWVSYIAIPKSWSKKKTIEMQGKFHQQKPDRDNIDKAILDALFGDDSGVAIGFTAKLWDDGKGERIEILIAKK